MTHYMIDCNWDCKYNLQGNCERCGENRERSLVFEGNLSLFLTIWTMECFL